MRHNPVTSEMAAQARRMRVQGASWHGIANALRANPMDVRDAVLGVTHGDLLDPPPVREPKGDTYSLAPRFIPDGAKWSVNPDWVKSELPPSPRPADPPPPVMGLNRGLRITEEDIQPTRRTGGARFILTQAQRKEIKDRYLRGETQASLAKEYGVHINTVSRVVASFRKKDAAGQFAHRHASMRNNGPRPKLSEAQREEIKDRYVQGATQGALATEFGVHIKTITRIVASFRRGNNPDADVLSMYAARRPDLVRSA